jgi:hypothetical protein
MVEERAPSDALKKKRGKGFVGTEAMGVSAPRCQTISSHPARN